MSNLAIRVDNLSKKYKLEAASYRHDSLRDQLADWAKSLFVRNGRHSPQQEHGVISSAPYPSPDGSYIWALKSVSFEIKQGEVVGIIGRNGAGKSTLLKILSRITEPTGGFAEIHGRVGSLLEVGTGFHRDLTGRENIYLNAAILGMKRAEVERKFDQIVDFAGIERFIDTPVKRYSSGMYVRLAFAVAAHLEPEILIVDEVLAVGDAEFQNKCLGKMDEVRRTGRTVLFVSHSMPTILKLCPETIVLDSGQMLLRGPTSVAVEQYLHWDSCSGAEKVWREEGLPSTCGPFRPIAVRAHDAGGALTDIVQASQPFSIDFEYRVLEPIRDLRVQVKVFSSQGDLLFVSTDTDDPQQYKQQRTRAPGHYLSRCHIPANLLNNGPIVIGVSAAVWNVYRYFWDHRCLRLTVNPKGGPVSLWEESRGGFFRPALRWEIESR